MTDTTPMNQSIAVALLVRGADANWREGIDRFVRAVRLHPPGRSAVFYTLFKGFGSGADRRDAAAMVAGITDQTFDLPDDAFDIGAYLAAAHRMDEAQVCFLNGYSEPLSTDWLAKMACNYAAGPVGAIGATASFETLRTNDRRFPKFPNPHLRSNAFLIDRTLFLSIASDFRFRSKTEAFQFESGKRSFTARLQERGLRTLVVGKNGRGYEPTFWPLSATFRIDDQANLLIGDNQTRAFDDMPWAEKRDAVFRTWGQYADPLRYRLEIEARGLLRSSALRGR